MKKTKTLIIVESPNKIKKISEYLGPKYIIRASFGHIMDLSSDIQNNLGIDIKNDFRPKYKILPEKKDKLSAIIEASSDAHTILIATDPDREGEAIAFHLASCLDSCGVPIKRIIFNEITKKAIQKAVKNPTELNNHLYDAQQARRVLDRIVGFLVSPFVTKELGGKLSAGRVQSVAVRLISDRDKEIQSFIPEEYWNINVNLYNNKNKLNVKYLGDIKNSEEAANIKKHIEQSNFEVTGIESKEKLKSPLPPLTTSKLQQIASSKLNFAVDKTMKLAQSLYESGFISYMRTDSTRLSDDFLNEARDWLNNNNYQLPITPNIYATKSSAQDAHEAIRPTELSRTPDKVFISDDELAIYTLIWDVSAASQLLPAKYDTSKILLSSGKYKFAASGKILKDEGYLKVFKDFDSKDDETELPNVKSNEMFCVEEDGVILKQKFTSPPSRYTEGNLVRELEKRNIGRPSTYANIITTIKNRKYVEIKNKTYQATEIGNQVSDVLCKYFKFLDYNYTAKMEEELDLIADNKLSYVQMLDSFFKPFKNEMKRAYIDTEIDYNIDCPKCKDKMILRHGTFGYFMLCINFDCKKIEGCELINDKPVIKTILREEIEGIKCPNCGDGMYRNDGRYGPFYACVSTPDCRGTRKIFVDKDCPNCNNALYITSQNGELRSVCSDYKNCKYSELLTKETKQRLNINWIYPNNIEKHTLGQQLPLKIQGILNER